MKQKYQPPKTGAGQLRTPVNFYEYQPHHGPEPGDEEKAVLYECFAEIYNPSMKDREILNSIETKQAVTIKIRDPHKDYISSNKHFAEILDDRYKNIRWNIIDVRYDFTDNRFITILLGVIGHAGES